MQLPAWLCIASVVELQVMQRRFDASRSASCRVGLAEIVREAIVRPLSMNDARENVGVLRLTCRARGTIDRVAIHAPLDLLGKPIPYSYPDPIFISCSLFHTHDSRERESPGRRARWRRSTSP